MVQVKDVEVDGGGLALSHPKRSLCTTSLITNAQSTFLSSNNVSNIVFSTVMLTSGGLHQIIDWNYKFKHSSCSHVFTLQNCKPILGIHPIRKLTIYKLVRPRREIPFSFSPNQSESAQKQIRRRLDDLTKLLGAGSYLSFSALESPTVAPKLLCHNTKTQENPK